MKISEIFKTLQGEGKNAGVPCVFVRLSGCNLECEWCDTKYHTDGYNLSNEGVANQIKELQEDKIKHIIFTGGEPLLQQVEIMRVIELLGDNIYSIETNGTVPILDGLMKNIDCLTVSPKMNNAKTHNKKLEILTGSEYKFVIQNKRDIAEIKLLLEKYKISKDLVSLMPEGASREEQLNSFEMVWNLCVENGFKFSPRLHVLSFNTKRGV